MKRVLTVLLVMLLALALTVGCGGQQTPAPSGEEGETIKVGFVYIGPPGDGGYTYAHDQGRLYLEKELGDKVQTIYKESVPEDQESEKVMRDMIDQGCKIIFATSFGYMDYVEKVAKEFGCGFMHCSGYKLGPNYGNYFGRIEEPRYLSG